MPTVASLPGAIDCFVESANLVPLLLAIWKFDVNLFFNLPIEIGRFEVNLVQLQVFHFSDGQEHSEGVKVNNRGKCLCEVDSSLLCESPGYHPGLEAVNGTIRKLLQLENPFGTNSLLARREIHH